ncbi:hypothetical protein BDV96DRAFT_671353 [Lophiotrema nucula]|uniref:NAD(P)-binding protein n=1 Tax=Lophiotrema nucula TaxID=690887 RepID=A0A6A5YM48_9PLEO|nr:hypothetical protein BDV96DRAFT_671353 [Lophiotrema nucula]
MPSSLFNPESIPDLKGKVYLVTGGNTGIGKATVAGLAEHGATVYIGARSKGKAELAIADILKTVPSADLHYLHIDLADLSSVAKAAKTLRENVAALYGLINNAGIMGVPYAVTNDGYEIQFQTNYLSHWLLTYHLVPLLVETARKSVSGSVRVVNVTSDGHEHFTPNAGINFEDLDLKSASSMTRYGQSKLANVLHIKHLNTIYGPKGEYLAEEIVCAAVHPGHIDTALNKQTTALAPASILGPVTRVMKCLGILDEQEKGAWSSIFAIASSDFGREHSGAYVVPYAKIGTPSEKARDAELARRLFDWTEKEMRDRGILETRQR